MDPVMEGVGEWIVGGWSLEAALSSLLPSRSTFLLSSSKCIGEGCLLVSGDCTEPSSVCVSSLMNRIRRLLSPDVVEFKSAIFDEKESPESRELSFRIFLEFPERR